MLNLKCFDDRRLTRLATAAIVLMFSAGSIRAQSSPPVLAIGSWSTANGVKPSAFSTKTEGTRRVDRIVVWVPANANEIDLAFYGAYPGGTMPNPVEVSASLEGPPGTPPTMFTREDDQTQFVGILEPNQPLVLRLSVEPQSTEPTMVIRYIRVGQTCPSGGTLFYTKKSTGTPLGDGSIAKAANLNGLLAGNIPANAGAGQLAPWVIAGRCAGAYPPNALLLGDSIAEGIGDAGLVDNCGRGWFGRRFEQHGGYTNLALNGDRVQYFGVPSYDNRWLVRKWAMRYFTNVVDAYWRNDAGNKWASTLAKFVGVANAFRTATSAESGGHGIPTRVWQIPPTPRTSSVDLFATVEGQTSTEPSLNSTPYLQWLANPNQMALDLQGPAGIIDPRPGCVPGDCPPTFAKWRVGQVVASGYLTKVLNTTTLEDSTFNAFNISDHQGLSVRVQNQNGGIRYANIIKVVSAKQLALTSPGFSPPPAVGDRWEILERATPDGVHPTTRAHARMGDGIDLSLFVPQLP